MAKQILIGDESFTVNDFGLISDPGKFEGEPPYVPYFWDMDSDDDFYLDDDETLVSVYRVRDEDILRHPELAGVKEVKLYENNDGFVCQWKD